MPFVKAVRALTCAAVILAVLIPSAFAQTSIGFENPDDTTDLLEYRLPEWGYRTWDLKFNLDGNGADYYRGGLNDSARNRLSSSLFSSWYLYRESEQRVSNLYADIGGNYRKSHDSSTYRESSGHSLSGNIRVGGQEKRYLGEGPFSLQAALSTTQGYAESIDNDRIDQEWEERRQFRRDHLYLVGVGGGWGRVRDVTPLIRAGRLSERLVSLGRPALTSAQVQDVAVALAEEHGYRMVFDRPDKSFWRDVLEPMLDPARPLSPYEIFYLRDIMEENIGPRRQGAELKASFVYDDHRSDGSREDEKFIRRGPTLTLVWARNLNLNHQLALDSWVGYSRESQPGGQGKVLRGGINLSHLWTIADRYRWDTNLGCNGSYLERGDENYRRIDRDLETSLISAFRIFLENSLSLTLRVEGSNHQDYRDNDFQGYNEQYSRAWAWSYGIGFEYYLDRVLY